MGPSGRRTAVPTRPPGTGHASGRSTTGSTCFGSGATLGSFTRVATQIGSGIPVATGNGTTWADYDNDGDIDAFIASSNSALYANDGSGTFTQVTSGDIGMTFANRGWSPAWGDFDSDGSLDLAITHPSMPVWVTS